MAAPADHDYRPGLTVRAIVAAITCMLIMGMHIQYVEVILAEGSALAEQSLSVPAMAVFLMLLAVGGLVYGAFKVALLTRQEMLCVLYCMLISAPIMTQGMWHRFISLIATPPRTSSFSYSDAYSDKLWPHGPNLAPGVTQAFREQLATTGNVRWEGVEYDTGKTAELPVLRNEDPGDVSSISFDLPLKDGDKQLIIPTEGHLVSFLAQVRELGPDSYYFMRVFPDTGDEPQEVINTRDRPKKRFLHPTGFGRVGSYGATFPAAATDHLRFEIGLSGPGEIVVRDPKVFSVAALEAVYRGRVVIPQSEYDKLPVAERAYMLPKPDNMWSLAGVGFLIAGYIPLRDWGQVAVAWGTPVMLLILGCLAINVIMRRQWAESERYTFPLFQVPRALLFGDSEDSVMPAFTAVWKSRFFWSGFAVSLFWCLMKAWHFYDESVPSLDVNLPLSNFLGDPRYGGAFKVTFTISIFVLSLCMFFELSVLFSLVVGFFAFRMLFWVGQWTGIKGLAGYPWKYEQAVGAFIAYALVVVFFTRRYLWRVFKQAITFDKSECQDEVFSYTTAFALLAAVLIGFAAWAMWLGVDVHTILAYFAFLLLIGFVTSKFRAECGVPSGYFTPYNAMLFLALFGGITVFGSHGMLVCLVASGFLTVSVFFLIPGAQLELLEFGRRQRVVPSHLAWTIILGGLGGLFIGGWVFLSNAYALGGTNIKYQWSFGDKGWFFGSYVQELSRADSAMQQGEVGGGSGWMPSNWGFIYGAVVTIILAVIRQFHAGFFFHPLGFVLGSAHMLEWSWGSVLAAWFLRLVVVKLGGAATVREKLLPFFAGALVASVTAMVLLNILAGYLRSTGVDRVYGGLP